EELQFEVLSCIISYGTDLLEEFVESLRLVPPERVELHRDEMSQFDQVLDTTVRGAYGRLHLRGHQRQSLLNQVVRWEQQCSARWRSATSDHTTSSVCSFPCASTAA